MGGTVSLDSTPGSGSEFSVVLDFAPASPEALASLEATPAAPGEHALLGVRVLVVDDSDINLDVTKRILELEGAQVSLANNGQKAFERLQAAPCAVDVVLMDVQMQVLDGHDATRRIRLELGLADLPIIALTAGALSSERQRAIAAGMDDYIIKPFDAQALVRSILRHVKPAGGLPTQQRDAPPAMQKQTAVPWPEIQGIDASDACERLVGDVDLFRSMLKRLLDEFSDVAIPASAQDPAALTHRAGRMHKLRGGAGILGAKAIQTLAADAEAACNAGRGKQAAHLAMQLATQLQQMRQSAAPVFEAARTQAAEAAQPGGGEFDPQDLADFVGLLHRQSLSATNRFSALSPQLVRLLGKDAYEIVRGHMDNLEFSDAATALLAYPR
jgi:CheY-like chemotaxis protein